MAQIVKPKLVDTSSNVKVRSFSFKGRENNGEHTDFLSNVDTSLSELFSNIKQDFQENIQNPSLVDYLQDGSLQSFFDQFHIFDFDLEEEATPTTETPSENPAPETKPDSTPTQEDNTVGDGKTTAIPSSIKQTGIIANYTQNYGTRGWGWDQGKLAQAYKNAGSQQDGNMATLNGRYLVAVSPRFGSVGDNIDIQLDNGKVIHAVIADVKGSDATSSWGHELGGSVDVVEWEINGTSQSQLSSNLREKGWYGSPVTSITNLGSGNYF